MHRMIYTLGYQGMTMTRFLDAVQAATIALVVDIRWTPRSRKPGFSSQALASVLRQHGIDYVHLPRLGSPPPLRDHLAVTGDWDAFASGYTAWLVEQGDALVYLGELAQRQTVGLLCFEADVMRCHRSLVMAALSASLARFQWRDVSCHGEHVVEFPAYANPQGGMPHGRP